MIQRANLIRLIRASRAAGRHDFARAIAADWLAAWPGDHQVHLLLGEIEIAQGQHAAAAKRLQALVLAHPLFQQAYGLLGHAMKAAGDPNRAAAFTACGRALQSGDHPAGAGPYWANAIARAHVALMKGAAEEAVSAAQEALSADLEFPLPTLMVARALMAAGEREAALAAARSGHDRWPVCVPFRILMADDFLSRGDIGRGVEYLHQAVADDPLGFSASALLGTQHAYRDLWPDEMQATLSRPIPADVSATLGDNLLVMPAAKKSPGNQPADNTAFGDTPPSEKPAPTYQHSASPSRPSYPIPPGDEPSVKSNDLPVPKPWERFQGPDSGNDHAQTPADQAQNAQQVRQQLDNLAARIDSLSPDHEDRRVPAYIVLSSRTRLTQAFGESNCQHVDRAVMKLVEAVRRRPRWSAYRIYIDDPLTLKPFNLGPVDPGNAWQIKLRLADIDKILAQRGEMIGAVLIVGGNGIVPFHMLPNPTDDDDDAIPSDNPYATTDENYFAPEWPVGRMPVNQDANLLVNLLLEAAEHHFQVQSIAGWWTRFKQWLVAILRRVTGSRKHALGYTASIWRKASMAVFRTIGETQGMITSPPVQSGKLPVVAMRPVALSYFNLHGLEDAPEWFGQRDPLRDRTSGIEFPIALHPEDVVNSGRAPSVVFTEACFGANSIDKTPETSLCLKFLQSGSSAVIGSTKISYGSVTPPLIAADLLGRLFWEQLNRSMPVGEALRKAKTQLIARMYKKQEYLDGEDQKTLISFVLYGDPLFTPGKQGSQLGQKGVVRHTVRPKAVNTACAIGGPPLSHEDLDPATLGRVKSIVSRYLPGMVDADYRIREQRHSCEGEDHTCPTHQMGIKSGVQKSSQKTVVTLAKSIPEGDHLHIHYARLTLDNNGKVLKLAVSR
jgi:tetratricopeptide (TPR) repeat protein